MTLSWALPRMTLGLDRPVLCAVVNVTPDSFSDGGRLGNLTAAVDFALRCVDEGAGVLDVGGESTRPQGARPVTAAEEIARVEGVIAALSRATDVPISVDTTKAEVARAAVRAGAQIVNDVSGGRFDAEMIPTVLALEAGFILGHVRGTTLAEVHAAEILPPTVQDVEDELLQSLASLPEALRGRTVVDPGLGFGKPSPLNVALCARAGQLSRRTGRPVMLGPSRKRFLGELTGRGVQDRDDATVGACLAGVVAGAQILRVHDVKKVRDALVVFEAITRAGQGDGAAGHAVGSRA